MAKALLRGTAVISGAGSGIGQGIALSFARHGIRNLVLTDISPSHLTTTISLLKTSYPSLNVLPLQANVTSTTEVDSAIARAVKEFGRIDVAVNVAGVGGAAKRTTDQEDEDWSRVVNVNLDGVWRCQRAELRAMVEQEDLGPRLGRGNIINIASMYGLVGTPMHITATSYTASKHGVIGLTKADANQYAAQKIRINAMCPGYVATPLLMSAVEGGTMDGEINKVPMGRLAGVEEIGDACVWLGSEMASYVTGSSVLVDGGYCAN